MSELGNEFFTGCNYWASASGIYMWRRWDAENVDHDFAVLSAHGCILLRVFPLWPDFQPLTRSRRGGNASGQVLYKDGPLPNAAGVDPEMVERFRTMCRLAVKHGLKLIVGLVTGWMSGRCFIPQALEHLNPLVDSESILWQVRYVRHLVRALMSEPAIVAWDLGNECNCMGQAHDHFQAWTWTHAVAGAIRLEDGERPVVSGMHGLKLSEDDIWRIADQGELTDILTTHPYPLFTPNCNVEPSDGMRGALHGVAESLFYAGVGGKPCFIEEAGSLGPGTMSERRAGRLCRGSLVSSWAHNLPGYLWWCAFRQNHLEYSPYDDMAVERDLGLFTPEYEAKPQALELRQFHELLRTLPVLPEHRTEVVVLLTRDQDSWAVAYGCFLLAKQAGFDVSFQNAEDDLRPASVYWLPSVSGLRGITRRRYHELLARVHSGALLVASGFGMLEPFEPAFGVEVDYRLQRGSALSLSALGIEVSLPMTQRLLPSRGEVLLSDDRGEPVVTSCAYGAGICRFISAPLESLCGSGSSAASSGFHAVIAHAFESVLYGRMVRKDDPELGVTEYVLDNRHGLAVVVNYADHSQRLSLSFQHGWQPDTFVYGTEELESLSFAVISLSR